ncbi:MAG: hypothetical protein U0640_01655 [Phycisphaerales bacterium]
MFAPNQGLSVGIGPCEGAAPSCIVIGREQHALDMDPQAIQQLLSNPALSLGLALALSVPLGGAGFALWFWGRRSLKVASFFVTGTFGLLLGLIVGGLFGGRLEMIAGAIVGLIAGTTLGLLVFRFMVACMSGLAVFFLTVGIGASLIGGGSQGAAQPQSGSTMTAGSAMQMLQELAAAKMNAGSSSDASNENSKQPDLAALARDAVSKAKASKDHPKEYVDVRQLKKGPNRLQVEQTKDAAGKTKLVIKDDHYANVDTTPGVKSDATSHELADAKDDGAKDATTSTTSALVDEMKASGKFSDQQAAQLESLMSAGGLGNGAAMPDLKGVFAVLGVATFLGMSAFGVAMWLHRQAVAVLSAGMGAGLMVSSLQMIVRGALGASGAAIVGGTLGTIASAVVWIALMTLGAWLQLKRKPVVVLEQGAVYGRLPMRASGGEVPLPLQRVPEIPNPAPAPTPAAKAATANDKKPTKKAA